MAATDLSNFSAETAIPAISVAVLRDLGMSRARVARYLNIDLETLQALEARADRMNTPARSATISQ